MNGHVFGYLVSRRREEDREEESCGKDTTVTLLVPTWNGRRSPPPHPNIPHSPEFPGAPSATRSARLDPCTSLSENPIKTIRSSIEWVKTIPNKKCGMIFMIRLASLSLCTILFPTLIQCKEFQCLIYLSRPEIHSKNLSVHTEYPFCHMHCLT